MVDYHSTASVLAALRAALQDDPDPLEWVGIEIAAIGREIERARVLLAGLYS